MKKNREEIRNIAIIAHVDHGKTSLLDGLLKEAGAFRKNQVIKDRVMDSNELERERGITILSKNTALTYKDHTINIVDTPGHADFAGEVERVLGMVDGVLLLVDSFEGPMPQTRYVLSKALSLNLKAIVVINKIDRQEADPKRVANEVLELFMDLGANNDQLDFKIIYASARDGYARDNLDDHSDDKLYPLLDAIIKEIPPPLVDLKAPFRMIVSNIIGDEYVGRTAVARIERGEISHKDQVIVCNSLGKKNKEKIGYIYKFDGLDRIEVEEAKAGDIVLISGIEDINIGDTICHLDEIDPIPFTHIDEPTIAMNFSVNNSPFAGREGKYITSRHLRDRLFKELETNVSLRVDEGEETDSFKVSGRGELHLSILIETMRREGYEFMVSRAEVIFKEIDGKRHEPMERLYLSLPDEHLGICIEKLGQRKGQMLDMEKSLEGYTKLVFRIPARGLIGYRSEFLTDTRGNGIMNHVFDGYDLYKGDIPSRHRGSIIAWEEGGATNYGIYNAQERGTIFIKVGTKVYAGMCVGESSRAEDMVINVCKRKQMTNIRAAGSDDLIKIVPPEIFSLEEALEFISEDELVELTPLNIRIRKKILDHSKRAKLRG